MDAGSTVLSGSATLTPHLFYFIFSAPISFSLCFLTSPFLSLSLFFFDVLSRLSSSVEKLLYTYLLEKEMETHSNILAWEIPDRGAWWAVVHGVTKSWT